MNDDLTSILAEALDGSQAAVVGERSLVEVAGTGSAECAILEGMDSPSASASYPAVMEQRYRSRLPAALVDLCGPAHGTVQLPLHVAWSGQTAFDLDRPKPRMHMYRIVLAEGQRADVTTYLNRDLLVSQWPVLRTLISNTVRRVWEAAFPELREGQPAAP